MAPSTPAAKKSKKGGPHPKKQKTEQKTKKKAAAAAASNQSPRQTESKDLAFFDLQSTVDVARQPSSEEIQMLLDPYPKEQLISLLVDAALTDPELLARIREVADRDVSHRKVFIHGLGWDATREVVLDVFSPFGPIEELNVVVDKVTGRAKGYGFILFGTRSAAIEALKEPQKKIKNRIAYCQLASVGPIPSGGPSGPAAADTTGRKIYVSNVHAEADPTKLKDFFAKYGEIEIGPLGYDMLTGKSRGFALFVYKTLEGARKALEEPYKMFEGHQLHCQLAFATHKAKTTPAAGISGVPASAVPVAAPTSAGAGALGTAAQPVLAAVAAAQNLAMLTQNPAYAALLAQNPLVAAALNPAALNQSFLNPATLAALNSAASFNAGGGVGLGSGYGTNPAASFNAGGGVGLGSGYGTNPAALLGAYGVQGGTDLKGMQYGQSSAGAPSGSYAGLPPYY